MASASGRASPCRETDSRSALPSPGGRDACSCTPARGEPGRRSRSSRPRTPSEWAGFGTSVALRGTRLLVGAPDAVEGTRRGAVYDFEEIGGRWTFREKVDFAVRGRARGLARNLALRRGRAGRRLGVVRDVPPRHARGATSPRRQGELGHAVALTDTDGVVGAPAWPGDGGYPVGAVWPLRYSADGLTLLPILQPPDDHYGQRFGAAVAAEGSLLAVGAPGDDRGVVHLYEADRRHPGRTSAVLAGTGFPLGCRASARRSPCGADGSSWASRAPRRRSACRAGPRASSHRPSADLSVAMDAPASAAQGSLVTVRVDLINSGPGPAAGVAFRASFGDGARARDLEPALGHLLPCRRRVSRARCRPCPSGQAPWPRSAWWPSRWAPGRSLSS